MDGQYQRRPHHNRDWTSPDHKFRSFPIVHDPLLCRTAQLASLSLLDEAKSRVEDNKLVWLLKMFRGVSEKLACAVTANGHASDCLLPTKMVFRICETCLIPSDSVELRSSDQSLCDSCEEERRRTTKINAKNASTLNVKAQPFLPKRLHRRSRSEGGHFP